MTRTSPTSSLSTATLVGLFDELNKIAEVKKDQPLKKTLKNIALASLGGVAGAAVTMALPHVMRATGLAKKIEQVAPSTKMKFIVPAVAIGSSAITAAVMALQAEMSKKEEKKDV